MRQPVFGQLHLPAVRNLLSEHTVHIADAIAIGGHVHRRHALHEAGRQPPKAAIAQRSIRLQRGDDVDIDAQRGKRRLHVVQHFHVGRRIAHQPPDQEFEAEIIDTPPFFLIGFLGRCDPGVDHPVADREDDGVQPVMRLGGGGILADAIGQPLDNLMRQYFRVHPPRRGFGKFGLALEVHGARSPCLIRGDDGTADKAAPTANFAAQQLFPLFSRDLGLPPAHQGVCHPCPQLRTHRIGARRQQLGHEYPDQPLDRINPEIGRKHPAPIIFAAL